MAWDEGLFKGVSRGMNRDMVTYVGFDSGLGTGTNWEDGRGTGLRSGAATNIVLGARTGLVSTVGGGPGLLYGAGMGLSTSGT